MHRSNEFHNSFQWNYSYCFVKFMQHIHNWMEGNNDLLNAGMN
jgi:hypothetical protein